MANAVFRSIRESRRISDFELRIADFELRIANCEFEDRTQMPKKPETKKKPGSEIRNSKSEIPNSLVAVIMGSQSDWDTMRHADETLTKFGIDHECKVISAHRSPSLASEFGSTAEKNGLEVIIAAAGGAAHLAGVLAAHTTLPVLGVPMRSEALNGLDSLLATVQMPGGIPVGTLAIGKPGAVNAALFAVAILANKRPELRQKLHEFRAAQEEKIRATKL
jgi:5-(carboxyamino)imidazole ribonucleotide mutase